MERFTASWGIGRGAGGAMAGAGSAATTGSGAGSAMGSGASSSGVGSLSATTGSAMTTGPGAESASSSSCAPKRHQLRPSGSSRSSSCSNGSRPSTPWRWAHCPSNPSTPTRSRSERACRRERTWAWRRACGEGGGEGRWATIASGKDQASLRSNNGRINRNKPTARAARTPKQAAAVKSP